MKKNMKIPRKKTYVSRTSQCITFHLLRRGQEERREGSYDEIISIHHEK
jgi:hypothetical protein